MDRRGADWSEEEWLEEARRVRAALAVLGEDVAECLPGEPADCGQSVQTHYASYCSWLKAAAQLRIERDGGGGGPSVLGRRLQEPSPADAAPPTTQTLGNPTASPAPTPRPGQARPRITPRNPGTRPYDPSSSRRIPRPARAPRPHQQPPPVGPIHVPGIAEMRVTATHSVPASNWWRARPRRPPLPLLPQRPWCSHPPAATHVCSCRWRGRGG